jgi:hypothetical protein
MRLSRTTLAPALALSVAATLLAGCGGPDKEDFEGRLEDFSLPDGYRWLEDAEEPTHSATETEYAFRIYQAPAGADVCADLVAAFGEWADGEVNGDASVDASGFCKVTATDDDGVSQYAVAQPAENDQVLVAMYVRDDDWF